MFKLNRIQIILLCVIFLIFGAYVMSVIIYKIIKEKGQPIEFPKKTDLSTLVK